MADGDRAAEIRARLEASNLDPEWATRREIRDAADLEWLLARLDQAEARGAWLLTDNRRLRILAGEDDPADAADLQRIAGKPVGMLEASAVGGGRKFDPAGPSAPPRAGGEK